MAEIKKKTVEYHHHTICLVLFCHKRQNCNRLRPADGAFRASIWRFFFISARLYYAQQRAQSQEQGGTWLVIFFDTFEVAPSKRSFYHFQSAYCFNPANLMTGMPFFGCVANWFTVCVIFFPLVPVLKVLTPIIFLNFASNVESNYNCVLHFLRKASNLNNYGNKQYTLNKNDAKMILNTFSGRYRHTPSWETVLSAISMVT